jgi:electron transfer flavoprotein alpha subunit
MASGILVLCQHEGGAIKKTAFELLGKATELASTLGGSVSAVVIGDADVSVLGNYGAERVYHASGAAYAAYTPGAFAAALAAAIEQSGASVVLGAASNQTKSLFPRVGARIGAGVVTEATSLEAEGGKVVAQRPVYAGKAFSTVSVKSAVGLFSVRPNSFPAPTAGSGAASVVALEASGASLVKVVGSEKAASKVADLTEADAIVAGGRSLKSKENFDSIIVPLAESIGATPGASRAAVDAGYAPHSWQVGQTGKVVNPQLYIAAGISGAIQHLAGMRTSKVIVAINKDADAPIFQHSSYGLVDDLFVICPLMTKALNEL